MRFRAYSSKRLQMLFIFSCRIPTTRKTSLNLNCYIKVGGKGLQDLIFWQKSTFKQLDSYILNLHTNYPKEKIENKYN